jgi:hypothetical protein
MLALALPSALFAAQVERERTESNAAEANFLTFTGCEDVSVGVSVTEKYDLQNPDAEPTRTMLVFGSFVDICEFGGSDFFFGTSTVSKSEFVQDGLESASLNKTLSVDGHELHITLAWEGVGVTASERFKHNDKDARVKTKMVAESRNAEVTGSFIVNGLDRISENSLVNAQFDVVAADVKTKSR